MPDEVPHWVWRLIAVPWYGVLGLTLLNAATGVMRAHRWVLYLGYTLAGVSAVTLLLVLVWLVSRRKTDTL